MSTLRVIFVHGGFHNVVDWDYSEKLSSMLLRELKRSGLIAPRASQRQIDQIITFERVNYSNVGFDAQTRIIDAVTQQRNQLYAFVSRLSRALWLDELRKQIVGGYGDVFLYRTPYWGEQIRAMLLEKLTPYIGSDDQVTVVGHSLGSLVAFDTIFYNTRYNQAWQAANFKPTNLFTMGSPIALFSYDVDREFSMPQRELVPGVTNWQLVKDDGVWYNFLDAQDVVAYPLEVLFQDKFRVNDIVVQTGNTPPKAHGGYWNNDELVKIIAERLKMDYELANSAPVEEPVFIRQELA
jgi:(2Fe-2S) ferredoxin